MLSKPRFWRCCLCARNSMCNIGGENGQFCNPTVCSVSLGCTLSSPDVRSRSCLHFLLGTNVRTFTSTGTKNEHFISDKSAGVSTSITPKYFHPKKIVLVKKITRYEYEKHMFKSDKEEELKNYLLAKGSDYNGLIDRHDEYYNALDNIDEHLTKRGVDVKIVERFNYNTKVIDWADAIFTAGGDGTFLLAASKLKGHSKPVIGFNTDPVRSYGYLCLSKEWTNNYKEAIDRIIGGKLKWKWRQRIRVTMSGAPAVPVDLTDQKLMYPELRFWEDVKEHETYGQNSHSQQPGIGDQAPRVLPILALNEVFVGESLSARVSFYEISIDGSERTREKSSGITICTGTGSTSWYFNISHIPHDSVKQILEIANTVHGCNTGKLDSSVIEEITHRFNSALVSDPMERRMAYVVRDPVVNGVFQVECPRGFCDHISLRSRMWDGCVVVDGGTSFEFNNGAHVSLEMKEEDALRCIDID